MAYRSLVSDDGVRIGIDQRGAGSPFVLFLPAHPLSARAVRATPALAALLDGLAEGCTVAVAELRGAGEAEAHAPYTPQRFAQDVIAILEAVKVRPAVVWGHRVGGLTALQAAALRPDLVSSVVLDTMFIPQAIYALLSGEMPAIKHLSVDEFSRELVRAIALSVSETMQGAPTAVMQRLRDAASQSAPVDVWKESLAAAVAHQRRAVSRADLPQFMPRQPLLLVLPPDGTGGGNVEQFRILDLLNPGATSVHAPHWWDRQHEAGSAGAVLATAIPWLRQLDVAPASGPPQKPSGETKPGG